MNNHVQSGNPHNLTIKQHIFAKKSIERFCNNESRKVHVHLINQKKNFMAAPNNEIFVATRAWDQRSESGFMKKIEDQFQEIAQTIIDNKSQTVLGKGATKRINRFYAIWYYRYQFSEKHERDVILKSTPGSDKTWSQDEAEDLEKSGIIPINSTKNNTNSMISGRHMAGLLIQELVSQFCINFQTAQWGILESKELEFVVPEAPQELLAIPLTPNLCLYSKAGNLIVTPDKVRWINTMNIKHCTKYYFARDLARTGMVYRGDIGAVL